MCRSIIYFCIYFFSLNVLIVNSQYSNLYPQSPCPDNFQYTNYDGTIHGVIRFRLSQPATTVHTTTNFSIPAIIRGNVGSLKPIGDQLDLLKRLNQGQSITYRVRFPIQNPLPRLTHLTVNGEVICYDPNGGDQFGPTSKITLHHTLYLQSGTIPVNYDYFNRVRPGQNRPEFTETQPDPDSFGESNGNGNGNIFTSNRDSWNEVPYAVPGYVNRRTQGWTYWPYINQWTGAREFLPVFFNGSRPTDTSVNQITQQKRPSTRPRDPPVWQPQPEWNPAPDPTPTQDSGNLECGIVQGGNERVPLVHHGQAYNRGDWPWAAAVYSKREGGLTFKCGGTLISDRHVLSAAHCVLLKGQRTGTRDIVVRVGVYDPEDWGDDIPILRTLTAIHIHQSYNDKTLSNDISLFTLEKSVEFNSYIRAACLWEGDNDLNKVVGTNGVVTGWGQTEYGPSGHGPPRMVKMPIRSTDDCRASKADFHQLTSDTTLCAGDRNGAGPCNGDSGGGLFVLRNGRWRVRGIVSVSLRPDNGASTCNLNEFIVFTDASKYGSWINEIINR